MRRLWWFIVVTFLLIGCGETAGTQELVPSDEAAIKAAVEDYFRRDPELPPYNAEVEAVVEHWARVSIAPEGVENSDKVILYVQDQANDPNPVPTVALDISQPRNDAEAVTDVGWAIITKPQASFTDEELDAAMVPDEIRP